MRRFMKGDTQAVEGLNKLVQLQGNRSPNISLELLCSRVQIKAQLGHMGVSAGMPGVSQKTRWSAVEPAAQQLLATCMQHSQSDGPLGHEALPYKDDQEPRWAPPPPLSLTSDVLPTKAQVQQAAWGLNILCSRFHA